MTDPVLDEKGLEAARQADAKCQRDHCSESACNGFLCHAALRAYLASSAPVSEGLHGPYGWLNGHRALSEESWELESDPLENSEEYFAIPLYALVDPFKEIGRVAPACLTAASAIRAPQGVVRPREIVTQAESISHQLGEGDIPGPIKAHLIEAIAALVAALSPAPSSGEAEPVAWQRFSERTGCWSSVDADYAQKLAAGGETVRPLYAHPSPSGVNAEGDGYFLQGDVAIGVMASLAAAISLLERSPKTAAPSDKMFDQMLNDYRSTLEAARSALQAQAAASGAGEWVLVPREPTPDMLAHGDEAMVDTIDTDNWVNHCRNAWRAMIAAASTPKAEG